ncbi:ankyrin [Daldinia grandis]|nr:ankyrin [Daldinia grandis]
MKDDFDSHDLEDESVWSVTIKLLFEHGGTMEQVKAVLEELTAKIVTSRGTLDASEVKRLLDRLRSSKNTISVALARSHLKVGLENRANIQHPNHALKTTELETAIKWISALDFRASQRASQMQRLSGTGIWFLNSPQVRGWSEGRTTALWCHGLPGVGKTVLASTIFQQLEEQYLDKNVAVLITYCSFDDKNTHSTYNILSSFIRQIVEKKGEMSDVIKDMYAEHSQSHTQSRPTLDQLINLLSTEIGTFEKTFIIVDGLDEIPNDKDKTELLRTIESLIPLPQFMVTSRPVSSISAWFKGHSSENKYRILEESHGDNQPRYHCSNCDESAETETLCSSTENTENDNSIAEVSKGTLPIQDDQSWRTQAAYKCEKCDRYVCVNCYEKFDICFGCSNKKACFKWTWPGSALTTLIDNTRGKVNDLPATIAARVREEAHGIFLLAKEIMNTLRGLPSNIKDIYDNVFRLATARKLFIQHLSSMLAHETTWSDGHGMMADICLAYLQFKTFSSGACMGSDHKDLTDERRQNPQTAQLANDFLSKQAHVAAAAQIMWIDDMETSSGWDADDGAHDADCLQTTPLMVCLKNTRRHINIVKQIVSSTKDISINEFDVNYRSRTALMHALLLTRKDIDVDLQRPNNPRNNALLIAVAYGYRELSMTSSNQTALNLAASNGHLSIAELLLDRGANLDTGDMYGECVRLLIERGVNYRFKDSLGRGALHACANLDLDPNVQGNGGETPLHDAVGMNSVGVTKLLLEYAARTYIEDKMGRTPLVKARDLQRDRIFSILKRARKKEPKAMKGEDTDPLTVSGHRARVDTLSEEYKLPIHLVAGHHSRKELEEYLSDLGPRADEAINQVDSVDLETPLHFAARSGMVDSMRLLLERGAKAGLKDRWGFTPLHLAVDFG